MWEWLPGNEVLLTWAFWLVVNGAIMLGILLLLSFLWSLTRDAPPLTCPACECRDVRLLVDGMGRPFYACNECNETFYPAPEVV